MKRPLGWICLLFLSFIFFFYVVFPPSLPDYKGLHGREVYVKGQIISIKEKEVYGKLQVEYTLSGVTLQESSKAFDVSYLSDKSDFAKDTKAEKLNMEDDIYFHKKIYCYAFKEDEDVDIGAWVWVKGTFECFEEKENPGQFDSQFYYHIQGIGGVLRNAELIWSDDGKDVLQEKLQAIRKSLIEKLRFFYGEKYTGVMETILLGERENLNKELKQLFQEGGILHILTISGLHISMLGMGSFKVMRRIGLSQKCAAVMGMIFVVLYGKMIGAQAATLRAICMFALQMGAILIGRTYDRLTALSVAAVLLLLEEPSYVFYSGFLLSFGAVLGITVITPVLMEICKSKGRILARAGKVFSGGIGILLATFPVQLYFYYEYPIYSMLINAVLLPLLPYVVGLGLSTLAVPYPISIVGRPFVYVCEALLLVFEWVCQKSQELPGHSLVLGAPSNWQIACYYVCLIMCVRCLKKQLISGQSSPNRFLWIGTFFISGILLLWRPIQGLTCHFLSVGQGDCAVIQCGSQTYVVDCGSTSNGQAGVQILLPCLKYYGVSEVAGVFISHADEDHMNGIIQWLENYEHSHVKLKSIILPGLSDKQLQEEFGTLLELAENHDIRIVKLGAGENLSIGDLWIKVLHPVYGNYEWNDSNGYSQVLLFEYKGHGILMTGDIGEAQEQEIIPKITRNVTILKAPHHGSRYSSSEDFLRECKPKHIVLSYGTGNAYGHPHQQAVERMQEVGSTLWYTGRSGAITCLITGEEVRIKGFR